jgi:hypothetical protein
MNVFGRSYEAAESSMPVRRQAQNLPYCSEACVASTRQRVTRKPVENVVLQSCSCGLHLSRERD